MRLFIINEHPDWIVTLGHALDGAGIPWAEWYTDAGSFDLEAEPPPGVWFNRMSASSHTRGHVHAVNHARELVGWLESHGRRVLNGTRALTLEMSKVQQAAALRAAGLLTPRTIAVVGGRAEIMDAARRAAAGDIGLPFILKPNRGGKGLGVRLVSELSQLDTYLAGADLSESPDNVWLIQQYIRAAEPFITRCEFVGGEFVYAIRSSTAEGFELCPADGCGTCSTAPAKFSLRAGFEGEIVDSLRAFVREQGLDVCGIEFVEDGSGNQFVYDINGTTNYNPQIEADAGGGGATRRLMELFARELAAATTGERCPAGHV